MRIAQLGVRIDSSGAISGARGAVTALETVSTSAQRAAASVAGASAATATYGSSARALAGAAGVATGALGAQTAATGALTTGTTIATGATNSLAAALSTLATAAPILALQALLMGITLVMQKKTEATRAAAKAAREAEKAFEALSASQLRQQQAALESQRMGLIQQYQQVRPGDTQSVRAITAQLGPVEAELARVTDRLAELTAKAREAGDAFRAKLQDDIADTAETLARFTTGGSLAAEAFERAAAIWRRSGESVLSLGDALRAGDVRARALLETATELARTEAALAEARRAAAAREAAAARAAADRARELARAWADADRAMTTAASRGAASLMDALEALNARLAKQNAARVALAASIDAMRDERRAIAEQVRALLDSAAAYRAVVVEQRVKAALDDAEAEARAANITLTAKQRAAIEEEVRSTERLTAVRAALRDLGDTNPFLIPPEAPGAARDMADEISRAAMAAAGLAAAFGETGRAIGAALGQLGQLATSVGRLREAGGLGAASGVAAGLGIVGAGVALADALDLFGTRAAARARELREAARAFNAALEDFGRTAGTALEEQLRQARATAQALVQQAAAASGGRFSGTVRGADDIDVLAARMQAAARALGTVAPGLAGFAEKLQQVAAALRVAEEALRQQQQSRLAVLRDELEVRRLMAAGDTEAAEALRTRLREEAEVLAIIREYGAAANDYLAALREVQAAERAAAEERRRAAEAERTAAAARTAAAFGGDLAARQAALRGDEREALAIRTALAQQQELERARELLAAGTITAAMFAALEAVLGDELLQTLRDFDEQARRTAEALQQQLADQRADLEVRALLAQGRDAEAAALRQRIADERELRDVQDEALRARLLEVQALEAEARARAEAARLVAEAERQQRDIARALIAVYRELDPQRAEALEAAERELERQQQLAAAVDEATRARLAELFALQDQLRATQKLAAEQRAAAEAAERLAAITSSIEEQYRREMGDTFGADVLALQRWFAAQKEAALKAGASEETLRQLQAIYDSRYQKLIAGTMTGADQGAAPSLRSGLVFDDGAETITRSVARSVTSQEAVRLIDYAAQQVALLAQIARNTAEGGAGGVRVQVTVQGVAATGTPAEIGRGIADAIAPLVDEALGRRVGIDRRLRGVAGL